MVWLVVAGSIVFWVYSVFSSVVHLTRRVWAAESVWGFQLVTYPLKPISVRNFLNKSVQWKWQDIGLVGTRRVWVAECGWWGFQLLTYPLFINPVLVRNFFNKSLQWKRQDIGLVGTRRVWVAESGWHPVGGGLSSWCHQPRKLHLLACLLLLLLELATLLLPQAGLPLPPLPPPLHPLLPHHPLHLSASRAPRPPPLLLPASPTLKSLPAEDKTASSIANCQ